MPLVTLNRKRFNLGRFSRNVGYGDGPYGGVPYGGDYPVVLLAARTADATAAVLAVPFDRVFNEGYGWRAYGTTPYGGGAIVVVLTPQTASAVGSATAATIDLVFNDGYGWRPYGTSTYGGGPLVVVPFTASGSGAVPAATSAGIPPEQLAVSLSPIDGELVVGDSQTNFLGDGYFARHRFTFAAEFVGSHPLGGTFNGLDDPNILMIGTANTDPGYSPAVPIAEWFQVMTDVGLTICLPISGNVPPVEAAAHGVPILVPTFDFPTPASIPAGGAAAVIGEISGEEASTVAQQQSYIDANNVWISKSAPGRLTHIGYFDNVLNGDIEFKIFPGEMVRSSDILTVDLYCFAGAWDDGIPADLPASRVKINRQLYRNYRIALGLDPSTPASPDETGRGAHYGSMLDSMRKWWNPGESRPSGSWVETGAPYTELLSQEITPAQFKWSMWSVALHGARLFALFDHSFRADVLSFCTYIDPHYGYVDGPGGNNTGMYAASKVINRQLLSIASVVNSPNDGYFVWGDDNEIVQPGFLTAVTSTNPRLPFSGVDAACKWEPNQRTHYIMAGTRESESVTNIPVTFQMRDHGQTVAHEVFENRDITITRGGGLPAGVCQFTDTFATAVNYHCYRIDNPPRSGPRTARSRVYVGTPRARITAKAVSSAGTGAALNPTVATNSSPGQATAFTAGASGTAANPTAQTNTGQSAVTLVAIDGEYISGSTQSNFIGDGYYTRKGFATAAAFVGDNPLGGTYAGWDDPNFLVIGNANTDPGGLSATAAEYLDILYDAGLTCGLPTSGALSAADFAAHNMACTVTVEIYPTPSDIPTGARSAVMGIISNEEPSTTAQFNNIVNTDATWLAADTLGRFHHTGFFDNVLNGDIDFTLTPHDMTVAFDAFTCDSYWFAGAWDNGIEAQIPLARYNIRGRLYLNWFNAQGEPDGTYRSVDETARGCHYGSQNDSIRKWWSAGESRPMGQWVETGAPYTEADSMAITPAQLKWALWSIAVHGSRLFPLFDHSFRPDHVTASTFNDSVYGFVAIGGANTGIYVAARTINRQLLSIASVVNSPNDGYIVWGDDSAITQTGFMTAVTSTNARSPFTGVDAVCKWQPVESKHYILAHTRESQTVTNIPVTFRMVDQGQTSAVRLFDTTGTITITRGGSIPAGFCEFSDTFATAASYKCYRID